MSRRFQAGLWVALLALSVPSAAAGLSCVPYQDVEAAATEALREDHPGRGFEYIVGRLDAMGGGGLEPLALTVTPTHVFSGDHAQRIRLAARSDGPPTPTSWTVGGLYFLALDASSGLAGVEALVAPCAPNFRIVTEGQLDRLLRAAPAVEVRDSAAAIASSDVMGPVWLLGAAVGAAGIGTWLAFRRPWPRGHR